MSAEDAVRDGVSVLVTVVEVCGAVIIAVGAIWAFIRAVAVAIRTRDPAAFVPVRLSLGQYLVLGLEFQLASDVLRTAISPSFNDIGQLAAIATIRTALNYFLSREIAEERRQLGVAPKSPPPGTSRAAPPRPDSPPAA
jgi:uncharacterized membrane protein